MLTHDQAPKYPGPMPAVRHIELSEKYIQMFKRMHHCNALAYASNH